MPLVLDRAQRNGIEVVGIAVGVDRTNVKNVYDRYVMAMVPRVVPQALRSLYLEESTAEDTDHSLIMGRSEEVEEILKSQEKLLDHLQKEMSQAREANLVQGDKPSCISVDVAFCIDCTGSMSAWLDAAKDQIVYIAEEIVPRIKKDYPGMDIELHFSVIEYRDYGDPDQHRIFPLDGFTSDVKKFSTHIQGLVARGGGDGPEDLLGALDLASKLNWSSNIKFLVIVTDSPAHTRECNDDLEDLYPDQDPKGLTMKKVINPICKLGIDLMFCRIKKTRTRKTELLMKSVYDAENKALKFEHRSLKFIDLFNQNEMEVVRFHFVFCLDESGSMQGSPWSALLRAYQAFIIKRRNDQGLGDVVSTITFSSEWRGSSSGYHNQGMLVPIEKVKTNLEYHNGGTDFSIALKGAGEALAKTPRDCKPFLLFMSDGRNGNASEDPVTTIESFKRRYPGFRCDTIGMGTDEEVDVATLTRMAQAGGGSYHKSDSKNISSVFGEIAAGCAAMDGMVQMFGEEIAKMVSSRIVLEHL